MTQKFVTVDSTTGLFGSGLVQPAQDARTNSLADARIAAGKLDLLPTSIVAVALTAGKIQPFNATGPITLPALPALSGLGLGTRYGLKNLSGNTITVPFPGSDALDSGATSAVLSMAETVELEVDTAPSGTGKCWRASNIVRSTAAQDARYLNPNDVGVDIIIAAGQSNMAGRGTPFSAALDPSDPRIMQYPSNGTSLNQLIQAVEPLSMLNTPTGIGPALWFARYYAASVPSNRRILIIPVAKDGTALVPATTTCWNSTVTNGLYQTMLTQTQNAITALTALGIPIASVRVAAALWVQGEADADVSRTGASYSPVLDALIGQLRSDLGIPDLPFVIGQMVPDYLSIGTRGQVNTVHAATPSRVSRTAFAAGVVGRTMADTFHYNAAGQRAQGWGLFAAYRRIINAVVDPVLPAAPGALTGLATSAVTATGLTLTWAATPGAATYYVEQSTDGTTFTRVVELTSPNVTWTVAGLTTGTGYTFKVTPVNTGGPGTAGTVTGTPTGDTTPPSQVTGLTATAGNALVNLSWTAATDNIGVTSYVVRRGGTIVTPGPSGTVLSFTDTGRTNGTAYSYTVSAKDAAGNEGSQSTAVTATPASSSDTTPPTVPGVPVATGGNAAASVTFTSSTDAVGVTGYRIYSSADGFAAAIASGSSSPVSITGLTNGTAYTFEASAYDAAGNESAKSAASNAVTPAVPSTVRWTSDSFTGGDAANINGRTTDLALGGSTGKVWGSSVSVAAVAIVSGLLARGSSTSAASYSVAENSASADTEVGIKVVALPGVLCAIQVRRAAVTATTYYQLTIDTTGEVVLKKNVSGTAATIGATGHFAVAGDRVSIRAKGTTVSALINGTVVDSVTDSSISAKGYSSLVVGVTGAFSFDDFTVDNV